MPEKHQYKTEPALVRKAIRHSRQSCRQYKIALTVLIMAICAMLSMVGAVWTQESEPVTDKLIMSIAVSIFPALIICGSIIAMVNWDNEAICGRFNEVVEINEYNGMMIYRFQPDTLHNPLEKTWAFIEYRVFLSKITDVVHDKDASSITISGDYTIRKVKSPKEEFMEMHRESEFVIGDYFENRAEMLSILTSAMKNK